MTTRRNDDDSTGRVPKLAAVAILSVSLSVLASWLFAGPTAGSQTVTELRLVDREGRLRATLGVDDDGATRLTLRDEHGTARWIAAASNSGCSVLLSAADGSLRATLTQTNDAGTVLGLLGPDGNTRAMLTDNDAGTGLLLLGPGGVTRGTFALAPDGRLGLMLADGTGNERLRLKAESGGAPMLLFFGPRHEPRMDLGISDTSSGLTGLNIWDERTTKIRLQVGQTPAPGTTFIRLMDPQEQIRGSWMYDAAWSSGALLSSDTATHKMVLGHNAVEAYSGEGRLLGRWP